MSLNWSNVKSLAIPVGGVSRDVKRVSIGGAVVWEKPSPLPYDSEVEYLQTDGSAFVDSGVVPTTYTEVTIRGLITANPSTTSVFCGTDIAGNPSATYAAIRYASSKYACMVNYVNSINFNPPIGSQFELIVNQRNTRALVLNGTIVDTFSGVINFPAGGERTLYIFGRNSDATLLPFQTLRLFHLTIYDNGILVRDFIPVRKGSVGYLYDRVSGALFGNAGTGAFGYGNDLPYPIGG